MVLKRHRGQPASHERRKELLALRLRDRRYRLRAEFR